jgi:serine protease Do
MMNSIKTHKKKYLSAALGLALMANFSISAWGHLPSLDMPQNTPSLAPMLQKVMPGIVNISVISVADKKSLAKAAPPRSESKKNPSADDDDSQDNDSDNSSEDASSGEPPKMMALGSGVIIDSHNGYVITNAHVLRNAISINLTLKDGRQFKAKLIGLDAPSDIAVLQIKANNLLQLSFSDSSQAKVGDFVVAIGNPYGIISGLQRTDLGIEGYEDFIQTDAPINPGNSGGALVNLQGKVIGINTAIVSPSGGGGNVGIGFAVPSNVVKSIMAQIIKYGSVQRGLMGVMVQPLDPALAEALGHAQLKGALITQVSPGSPAAQAGLKPGDIIQKLNDVTITEAPQITNIIGLLRMGSRINLEILSEGKSKNLTLITASPHEYRKKSMAENPLLFGVNLRDFNQITSLHGLVQGVQITGIAQESPLWRATPIGLRPGDVIITANMKPVHDTTELIDIAKKNKELVLNVYRGTGAMFVVVKSN